MEFRGMMGGLYRISEWIMRFSVTNVLWIICSIPFIFVTVVPFLNPEAVMSLDQMKSVLLIGMVVAPFFLFPATTAMFTSVRKWIIGEEDAPLLKTFFRGYKENYVQSLITGWMFMLIYLLLYLNYSFYSGKGGVLGMVAMVFLSLFLITFAAMIHSFSIMVHFHMKVLQILKNSFLITLGNPLTAIMMLLADGFVIYMSSQFTFLIPFFAGTLMTYLSFISFYRVFQKMQARQEKLNEQQKLKEDQAELPGAAEAEQPVRLESAASSQAEGEVSVHPEQAEASASAAQSPGQPAEQTNGHKTAANQAEEQGTLYVENGPYTDFHKRFNKSESGGSGDNNSGK
ncbi:YesL family protein [Paenibacillus sp. y28]|uniref:YesL family protein n=1 Tax=Paenibacillus sp. y28 TaxID=3129110 RepID=UPI003019BA80